MVQSLECVLILYKEHCLGFHILFRCNRVMVKIPFFLESLLDVAHVRSYVIV